MDAEKESGPPPISTENASPRFSEEGSPRANAKKILKNGDQLQMWVDDEDEDDVVFTGPQDDMVLSISSSSEESLDSDADVEDAQLTQPLVGKERVNDESHCVIDAVMVYYLQKFSNQSAAQSLQKFVKDRHPGISSSLSACHASVSLFKRKPWLTACDQIKKIFCWPCLLFGYEHLWHCSIAKIDFMSIALAVSKHEITAVHKQCLEDLEAKKQSEMKASERRELYRVLRKSTDGGTRIMTPGDEDSHAESMLIGSLLGNKLQKNMSDELIKKFLSYGRPRPPMRLFLSQFKIKELPYDTVPWLTASDTMNLLFCWPCLLFVSLKNWSYGSTGNYSEFEESMKAHENTITHMLSMLKLKAMEFRMKRIRERELELTKTGDSSEKMCDNVRKILKPAIEAVCCLKKKSSNSEISIDDYIRLMEFLGCCNHESSDDTQKQRNNRLAVSKHLDGILNVIGFFVASEIVKDVSQANFVSFILEDTSPSLTHSLVAVIIRYVDNNGAVHERFVKFIALNYKRKPKNILPHIRALASQFDCETKLVGITYDGGVVCPKNVAEFNKELKSLFPTADFFPYREHDLRKTLIQALSHITQLRLFFHQLCDLSDFFEETPNAISTFLGIVYLKNAGEDIYNKVWDFSSCFAITLWDYREDVLAVFEKITNNPHEWPSETVIRAFGFTSFLQDSTNLSLIFVTKIILSAIEELPPVLAGPFKLKTWEKAVDAAVSKLSTLKDSYCLVTQNFPKETKSICSEQTFHLMVDTAEQFILNRYESLDTHAHFTLLDDPEESTDGNATEWLEYHSSIIDPERLDAQLKFHSANSFFTRRSVTEKLKIIYDYDMVGTLPELVKFLHLVLTIPLTVDTGSSAVHKLRTYIKENSKLTTSDALFWMERELLERLETEEGFVDRVLEHIE
ncbi:Hypothetical protein NTJ_06416 [Nesidiocoris tenuis]|uniref:DUF4371 domain-containing protein n=1 Tax=Nesidiocoris tenuis TaxID=355587 RepID=A0ABN7AT82_9HEMI|nr:Hypothetical protein NTJ_06416 [Nesidiocoris tenuis]